MGSTVARLRSWTLFMVLALVPVLATPAFLMARAQEASPPRAHRVPTSVLQQRRALLADRQPTQHLAPLAEVPCQGGQAGPFPCQNIDLLAFLPLNTVGGGQANDVWGWTDSLTGKEYALLGRTGGTSFVDISDPANPVYLGNLPAHGANSTWRDVETYGNFVVVVSEAFNHGMQIFDLTRLRTVTNPPVTFSETAHYGGFSSSHTVSVNNDTGFAYANGTNTCGGGLHMVNINDPRNPVFAGCYTGDGYTHDAQCVIYTGPDAEYQSREVCFGSNEDTVTIVDVTNKSNPTLISRTPYPGSAYTHQGWLNGSQRFFVVNDELDEVTFGHNYWTRFFNVSNLDAPRVAFTYRSPAVPAIDHNLFITRSHVFESNYRSGLRILGAGGEVAYFDIYPANDLPEFNGTWSNYPFFSSGVVAVSGIEQGLFILRPNLAPDSGIRAIGRD